MTEVKMDEGDQDPYKVLGLDHTATQKDIDKAYRKLSLKCHPDRVKDDPKAAEKFAKLTKAKEQLSCAQLRAKLDARHKAQIERENRTAATDGVKRKLREDLEIREKLAEQLKRDRVAAGLRPDGSEDELRLKRLKAENAELLSGVHVREKQRQQEAAKAAQEAFQRRQDGLQAQVLVTWKGELDPETVERRLQKAVGSTPWSVQASSAVQLTIGLPSREEALKVVLAARTEPLTVGSTKLKLKLGKSDAAPAAAPEPSAQQDSWTESVEQHIDGAAGADDLASMEARMLEALKRAA